MPMLTPAIIAREALMILSNNLVAANLVYRGDTSNFTGSAVGDTITIRRPAAFTVNNFTSTISPQAINEGSVALVLEKHADVSVNLTSKQATLELDDFSQQVVAPAMTAIAEDIDTYLYSKYVEIYEIAGDGTLNAVSDLAAVEQELNVNKVPISGRVGFLSPAAKAAFHSIEQINRLDARGEAGRTALEEASMGRVMGIQWYGAQGVARHVAGVPGGTPTATGTIATPSVTIAAGGASGTYKRGDIVTFANHSQTYVVTADVTLNGSGAGTLAIFPALVSTVPGGTAVALTATHDANIVGHPRGISLVTVPLELPMETMGASVVSANGITVRVVYGYDITTKTNVISFDVLAGAKVTDPRLVARFRAS
jgi:P22 coat protein - gene protein 5